MSTDLFERYASLDPARSPQAAPDWESTAPVPLAAIDERTPQMHTVQDARPTSAAPLPDRRRNGILVAAAVFAIVLLAGAVLVVISTQGEPQPAAPIAEEVVAQVIEAGNARDAAALTELYHPDIFHKYDAYPAVGHRQFNVERTGREEALEAIVNGAWANWSPFIPTYEVLEVDGNTVTTAEEVYFGGTAARHIVTYEISDEGLVLSEVRVVQGNY